MSEQRTSSDESGVPTFEQLYLQALEEIGEAASNTQKESTRTSIIQIINGVFRQTGHPLLRRK